MWLRLSVLCRYFVCRYSICRYFVCRYFVCRYYGCRYFGCRYFVRIPYFSYYKLRYDQLNYQLKSIEQSIRKQKSIFIGRQKIFLELIHVHNSLAIEIQKCNLLLRRTVATMFIGFSLIKIITLYMAIYVKNTLIRILAVNIFVLLFIFGFGISLLYSLQIHSSKSSYKIIHSIVCNCKISIRLRLQVISN